MGANEVVFQRRVTVRHEVDAFVAGGGPAGVARATNTLPVPRELPHNPTSSGGGRHRQDSNL